MQEIKTLDYLKEINLWDNLKCFLFACVFCTHAFRIVAAVYSINNIDIVINIICFLTIFINLNYIFLRLTKHLTKFHLFIVVFLIYCSISCILTSKDFNLLFKFFIGVGLAYSCGIISQLKINKILNYISIIYFVYIVFVLANLDVVRTLRQVAGIHYLTTTLPMGLCATFNLCRLLYAKNAKFMVFNIIYVFITLFTVINFSGRGNILFPIVIFTFCCIWKLKSDAKKMVKIIILILVLVLIIYFLVVNVMPKSVFKRLVRLINDIEDEPRVLLYKTCINYIFSDYHWIFGIGFSKSSDVLISSIGYGVYPHNFALELFGEMGLIGLLICSITFILVIKASFKVLKFCDYLTICDKNKAGDYIIVFAATWFYILTFAKSYSIYDGYQLFMWVSMLYTISNITNKTKKNHIVVEVGC